MKGGKQFLAINMIGMKKQINLKTKTNGCFRIQTMLLFLVSKVPVVCIFFNAVRVSYVIPSFYCYHSIVCMHDRFLHIHPLNYVIIKSCTNWCRSYQPINIYPGENIPGIWKLYEMVFRERLFVFQGGRWIIPIKPSQ